MTNTTDTRTLPATYTIRIGRTEAQFVVETETDEDAQGYPFTYEYECLPLDAQVDIVAELDGTSADYDTTLRNLRIIAEQARDGEIIMATVAEEGAMNFMALGWSRPAEVIEAVTITQQRRQQYRRDEAEAAFHQPDGF